MRGLRPTRLIDGPPPTWLPADLGGSLKGLWDADRADLITASGGAVSSWKDVIAGYDLVQATGASRPTYSATSFGGLPGVTFDGTDDYLSLESQPFPSGSTGSEIWCVVDQQAAVGDSSARYVVAYGSNSTNAARTVARSASTLRAIVRTGTGTGSFFALTLLNIFSGRRTVRGIITPTETTVVLDNEPGFGTVTTAGVPATGTTRVRVGAQVANTATQFWLGGIAMIAITDPLTAQQANDFTRYCMARSA